MRQYDRKMNILQNISQSMQNHIKLKYKILITIQFLPLYFYNFWCRILWGIDLYKRSMVIPFNKIRFDLHMILAHISMIKLTPNLFSFKPNNFYLQTFFSKIISNHFISRYSTVSIKIKYFVYIHVPKYIYAYV